jgi:hypothetical protein
MATYGKSFNAHGFNKPGAGVQVKYEGDWHKLPALFRYLTNKKGGQGIKRDIAKAHRDFALKYKAALIKGILTGGGGIGAAWPPHSPDYKEANQLLRLTGNYFNALVAMKVTAKNYSIRMNIDRGAVSRKSAPNRLSLGQYAVIHEVGSVARGIPARPLWQPAFNSIGGQRAILGRTKGAVQKRLKKLGVNVGHTFESFGIKEYGT